MKQDYIQIPGHFIKFVVIITITIIFNLSCFGQTDSVKSFKNSIRLNVTNPMLFGWKYNVLGYERVIKEYQTASVSFGRIAFPRLIDYHLADSIGLSTQQNDKGFNFSLDYRFYLRKENKHGAPRGVYLGPYYAYNYFSRDLTWSLNLSDYSGEVSTNTRLTGNFIGAQMGYQFILWDRLAIDMILLGPGKWFFNMKTSFNTTLSDENETLLLEKINEKIQEKFPASDFVFKGGGFEAKKSANTSTTGLRYLVNIGFRF